MSRIWGLADGAGDDVAGRRRRRGARTQRPSLGGQLLRLGLAVVIASVALGIWNLRVTEVSVRGARLSDRAHARAVAAPLLDQRWVGADLGAVGEGLRALPWVRDARVRRALFSRVEIELLEHAPLFRTVDAEGRPMVLTRSGEVLEAPRGLDLAALIALEPPRLEEGTLVEEDRRRLGGLLDVMDSRPWPFDRPWTGVDLRGPGGVTLFLEGGSQVWLGDENFGRRLERLRVSHAQWRDRLPGRIDLRFDRQIVVAENPLSSGGS